MTVFMVVHQPENGPGLVQKKILNSNVPFPFWVSNACACVFCCCFVPLQPFRAQFVFDQTIGLWFQTIKVLTDPTR